MLPIRQLIDQLNAPSSKEEKKDILNEIVNRSVSDKNMVFIWAVEKNKLPLIKYMLKNGAEVDSHNSHALKHAIQNNRIDLADLLIKYGADIHVDDDFILKFVINTHNKPMINYLVNILVEQDQEFNGSSQRITDLIDSGFLEKYDLDRFDML